MSTEKKFSDVDGYDDTLKVTVWDKGLRGKVSFSAQGDVDDVFVTVDVHEFKAWFDQAYTEVFGQTQREDVAHVLMVMDDDGSGWDIATPIAVYTDAREAVKARDEGRLASENVWISTAPINPNRKDQA